MLADMVDLCTTVFVVVDDIWHTLAPGFSRPGQLSDFSDSEVISLALIAEMVSMDKESNFLSFMRHNYLALFPRLPERSRFNRRRRNLWLAINAVRQVVLQRLAVKLDSWRVIDSLPIPVVAFCRAPQARMWRTYHASFGKVASKKTTFFGYKLHYLITLDGLITDFVLAPAHEHDICLVWDVTADCTRKQLVGDKGYISTAIAQRLITQQQIVLLTPRRRTQKDLLPAAIQKRLEDVRRLIETVGSQLTERFTIERNRAKSFWGLCTRIYTKLAAHTLAVYLNQQFGLEPLHLAQLLTTN